jgi:arylsulfatase A-like enzyme
MAGLKWSSWEGGTRIPYLVRWAGEITPGSLSNHILTNYDFMPTLAELIGANLPQNRDGLSFLPTLLGRHEAQQIHPFIVYASWLGPALVTADNWKLRYINSEDSFQLYDLNQDYREENDVAATHPEIVARLKTWLLNACDGNYQHGTPGAHFAAYPN